MANKKISELTQILQASVDPDNSQVPIVLPANAITNKVTPSALTLAALTTQASAARTALGLGTAAVLNVGTSASNIVQLNGSAQLPAVSAANLTNFPTLNQNTTGSAASLTTARAIYGNNFDGTTSLTQIIASTYGGTGNGFTKFNGATTSEKTYTLPNANATILTDNAAVTVAQGGTGQTTYTDGELLIGKTTGNTLNKATLTAGSGITITNGSGAITIAASGGSSVINGYINGFGLSYSSATVLAAAAGYAADSTNAVMITGTAFTKSTAGSWTAGTGNNGMGTGLTIANSTWYHVFAIINNGSYDVYFDTSVSAANKPASTTAFRRIGSFLTNGSAQIVQFYQFAQKFYWNTQVVDFNSTPPSSATLVTVTVPTGVVVFPMLTALYSDGSVANNYSAWSPGAGNTKKNMMLGASQVASNNIAIGNTGIATNTSGQVYHATNGANSPNVILYTLGWTDAGVSANA